MRYYSDLIEFVDEALFWVKLETDWKGVYFSAYYKKNHWKTKRKLFYVKLTPIFLDKLYFNIGQEMKKHCPINSCPIPHCTNFLSSINLERNRRLAYGIFIRNSILPKYILKLNEYINEYYIIKIILDFEDIDKKYNIDKEDLSINIKFDYNELHNDHTSFDFSLHELSDERTIPIKKINPIVKNINFKKIQNYIYEEKMDYESFYPQDEICETQLREDQKYKKTNFIDKVYIPNYQQALNYNFLFNIKEELTLTHNLSVKTISERYYSK